VNRTLPDFVVIGFIEKAHGTQGAVKVKPTTDHPPRFKQLRSVFVESPDGEIAEFQISKVTVKGEIVYLCFENIDTREKALALKGSALEIRREDCLPLEEGSFYHFELVGLTVKTVTGEDVGCVEEVWDLPANAVIVTRKEGREYLIPAIKEVIRRIDLEKGEIIIDPMEGLLE
jgi:16S rRNA processing protein RimM